MPAEPRYRAAPANHLKRVELDVLTAVYDRRSGQTHLLASPLPEIVDALGDNAWTLPDFTKHLSAQFDMTSDGGDAALVIAARLSELAALGLVEIA